MYQNLVIEGSSSKLYAFIGAVKVLEENKTLDTISKFVGVSSGSILATMLAVGYSFQDIYDILYNLDIDKIKHTPFFCGLYNFIFKYGYYSSSKYVKFLQSLLKNKTGNANYSFLDLYNSTGKTLIILGTCVNKREVHYYNYVSNPNMPIWKAIQISTCIPYAFSPVKWGSDTLIDGGVLENFPIYYIQEDGSFPNSRKELIRYNNMKHNGNKYTLGLKIMTRDYNRSDVYFIGNSPTNSLKDYSLCILNTMLTDIEKNNIYENYFANTVSITIDKQIDFYKLNLPNETKEYLFNKGIEDTKKYFII